MAKYIIMVTLPINLKLKKSIHKDMASAQDMVVVELYTYIEKATIHGGTAIWRCYRSNRFSEDIDVYIPLKYKKSNAIKEFIRALESRGFLSEKFREKENSIYAKLKLGSVIVRFEAVFKDVKNSELKSFEMVDGNFINIYTFSAEALIKEKVSAYISRRKIRDLYDIFFLLNFVKDRSIVSDLKNLIRNFKDPIDPDDLKAIIISGAVPNAGKLIEAIKSWAK